MTIFTRVWNSTYESLPEDDDDALEGAARIRHTRQDVGERLKVDHHWEGDANDGKHKKVTFRPSVGDPTLDPDEVALYGKTVGSATELFFKPETGSPIQLTFTAGEPSPVAPGVISAWPVATLPFGWVECNGQAISRTTFQALFNVIGTAYGAGDGSTTFNVPDLTGRTIFGKESVQTRITTAVSGIDGSSLGNTGGHQGTQTHNHTASSSQAGHTHSALRASQLIGLDVSGLGTEVSGLAFGAGDGTTNSVAPAITTTTDNFGSGNAANMPPLMILKWMIKT